MAPDPTSPEESPLPPPNFGKRELDTPATAIRTSVPPVGGGPVPPKTHKPIGIVNEQNTCFLNSTFQAVSFHLSPSQASNDSEVASGRERGLKINPGSSYVAFRLTPGSDSTRTLFDELCQGKEIKISVRRLVHGKHDSVVSIG